MGEWVGMCMARVSDDAWSGVSVRLEALLARYNWKKERRKRTVVADGHQSCHEMHRP